MPQYRVAEFRAERPPECGGQGALGCGGKGKSRSDSYVLAVVLLASALFFARISTKLRSLRQRETLLALGWIIFLGTAVWLATFPVTFAY
jgi:hypothetical protein